MWRNVAYYFFIDKMWRHIFILYASQCATLRNNLPNYYEASGGATKSHLATGGASKRQLFAQAPQFALWRKNYSEKINQKTFFQIFILNFKLKFFLKYNDRFRHLAFFRFFNFIYILKKKGESF